jgi:predicted Rossmann fold flavoprotein
MPAQLWLGTDILDIRRGETGFIVTTSRQSIACDNLVMACGGASIPKMGATNFGYKIAGQFGLNVIDPVPALVPLTFTDQLKEPLKALAGVSTNSVVSHGKTAFEEALLFTHRGLSGPSILQISSYWAPGDMITLDMAPGVPMFERLKTAREHTPRQSPQVFLSHYLPSRLAQMIASGQKSERLADMSDTALRNLALMINSWMVKPAGSEGFRTAEVTKGGVDTQELSSKTMEAKAVPGLYFIGEVVDVTGHLGGHNFQWAWASAVACGDAL